MTGTNPSRRVIYLTNDEYDKLSDAFLNSELVDTRNTYGANHPLGEYVRQLLSNNPTVDASNYKESVPSVRYTEMITVEFPPEQYKRLREQYESTPVAKDKNGRYALGGNSPFGEYLRLCLTQHLPQDEGITSLTK